MIISSGKVGYSSPSRDYCGLEYIRIFWLTLHFWLVVCGHMFESVAKLIRGFRNLQDQNRNFFEDFGTRISFIRAKRGLTLKALAGGKPASTAKSWEEGKVPRNDQWPSIAERLGLSVSFVFLGEPKAQTDYDFIRTYSEEIGNPYRQTLHTTNPCQVCEEPSIYEEHSGKTEGERLEKSIRAHIESTIRASAGRPDRLGWVYEQLLSHVRAPERWTRDIAEADDSLRAEFRKNVEARLAREDGGENLKNRSH